jgi:hypothetical protein
MPSGEVADTTKLATAEQVNTVIGQASGYDSGAAYKGHTNYNTTTSVAVRFQNNTSGQTAAFNATSPFTFGNGDWVDAEWSLPIVGW